MIRFDSNADEIAIDLRRLAVSVPQSIAKEARKWSRDVLREAKANAPVDSGKMKKDLTSRVKKLGKNETLISFGWGKTAFYWVFVEFGTKGLGAKPHMRPAIRNGIPLLQKLIAADLARKWER